MAELKPIWNLWPHLITEENVCHHVHVAIWVLTRHGFHRLPFRSGKDAKIALDRLRLFKGHLITACGYGRLDNHQIEKMKGN